jgi:YHS domain-containing protein
MDSGKELFMRARFHPRILAIGTAMILLAGCASQPSGSPSVVTADAAGHAECLVCKKNADLACVDVKVKQDTPLAVYLGKTYYFCSEECKADFQKNPEKYVHQK